MVNIELNNSFIKARIVHSCIVRYTPETVTTKSGIWPFRKVEKSSKDQWTLEIDYEQIDGARYSFTSKSYDHAYISQKFKDVMRQIKYQDSKFADALLEDAILSGGTKND